MKKITIILIVLFPFIFAGISNSGGSPGGHSSSMGDNNKTCTSCHGGSATDQSGWISTNIPSTGYIKGQTYTITVSGTHTGVSRFGFEATAEDNTGNKVGTIVVTNSGETKLVNSNKAISHNGNGFIPTGDSKTWSFDWTAPSAGAGSITFSTALCAANGDMGTSGDVVYKSNAVVAEDVTNSITDNNASMSISISPNPASNNIKIEMNDNRFMSYSILDITGKLMANDNIEIDSKIININISELSAGTYFVKLTSMNDEAVLRKFIKN